MEYESLFQVGGDRRCKPFEVEVSIDGKPLRMEIGTGASVSLVSQTGYQTLLKGGRLKRTNVQLKAYGGEVLKVLEKVIIASSCPLK